MIKTRKAIESISESDTPTSAKLKKMIIAGLAGGELTEEHIGGLVRWACSPKERKDQGPKEWVGRARAKESKNYAYEHWCYKIRDGKLYTIATDGHRVHFLWYLNPKGQAKKFIQMHEDGYEVVFEESDADGFPIPLDMKFPDVFELFDNMKESNYKPARFISFWGDTLRARDGGVDAVIGNRCFNMQYLADVGNFMSVRVAEDGPAILSPAYHDKLDFNNLPQSFALVMPMTGIYNAT